MDLYQYVGSVDEFQSDKMTSEMFIYIDRMKQIANAFSRIYF
jgi:hypothetical protein